MPLGVDFGGTRIKVAEVSEARLVRERIFDTPLGASPAQVLDRIAAALRELDPSPTRVGVAIPGEVDADGLCYRLPNVPGFEGVAIARELSTRTGARVAVENDGTAAAHGEALFGHGRQHASFLLLTLGTGIGGGLVIDRRLVRGAHGFAGEVGHVTVDTAPEAPPCVCGNRGCLESHAGTRALLAAFRKAGGQAEEIRDIAESARRGEPAGLRVFAHMAEVLAIALNTLQNTLDLDAVVFSGGVSGAFDLLQPGIRAGLRTRRFAPPLAEVPLLVSELGDRAGVVGAAHLPGLDGA